MYLKLFLFVCVSTISIKLSDGARILAVFATPSISHQVVFQPLWKELSKRHEMVVLTTDPLNDETLTNLTEISWKDSYQYMNEFKEAVNSPKGFFEVIEIFLRVQEDIAHEQLTNAEVVKILKNETEHFDLVIIEWIFPVMYAFKERFSCPMIGIMSLGADINRHDAVGNPSHPAYNPDMQLPYSPPLSLFERVASTMFSVWMRFFYRFSYLPFGDKLVEKYFGEGYPSLYDMERSVSMLFLYVNPIFTIVRPNFPAIIELSGLHIKEKKPLPNDLQTYLDEATEGVIYFSLGSNVQSANLDLETINTIVEALSELPYKVLWKWESDNFPNKPINIRINKWLPQQDVLGHHNVKLFITQGGIQSLEESIYNGVPMIGMPFFGDQPYNVKQLVKHGLGKEVDFTTITKEELKDTIKDVITNLKYKEKVEKIHQLITDTPMKSMDKAIWWIDYVLRHNGAEHLRSPAVDIPWYQYLLLDVLAVILTAFYISYRLVKFVAIKCINVIRRLTNKSNITSSKMKNPKFKAL